MFALFSLSPDYPMLPFSQRLIAMLSAIALTVTTVASLMFASVLLFPH